MMREIEQFYSTQIEEMPMFVSCLIYHRHNLHANWVLGMLPTSFKCH
jgi:hypothetical protein